MGTPAASHASPRAQGDDAGPQGTGKDSAAVILVALCAFATAFWVFQAPLPSDPLAVILAAGAVVLEVAIAPLGPFGFFSAAPACAIGLAMARGPGLASLSALLAIALRTVLYGRSTSAGRLKEAVIDLAPTLLAVGVTSVTRSLPLALTTLAATIAYSGAHAALSRRFLVGLDRVERIEALPMERALRTAHVSLPLIGAVLSTVTLAQAAALVAILWVFQSLAGNVVYRVRAQQVENTRGLLARSFEIYESARDTVDSTRRELSEAQVDRGTVEAFARHLAGSQTLEATLDLILDEAGRTVDGQSYAIFLEDEAKLVPARYRCPDMARFDLDAVAGVSEPIVERAWRQRVAMRATKGTNERRLFRDESQSLALPLQDQGVLYVGRAGVRPYTQDEYERLIVVASYGGLALQSTRRFEQRAEALRLQGEANERLQASLADLAEANARLRDSQEQLVQSTKLAAVGQLAAGVAHEINTPLGAIQISVESAAARLNSDPEKAAKRLENALSSVRRARGIIEKLLQYASPGLRKEDDVDLSHVVQEAAALLQPKIDQEGFHVALDLTEGCVARGNGNELQQVVVNLLLNALDASRRDRRPVRAFTLVQGEQVAFGVEDKGDGIKPASLPLIFDPFFSEKPIGQGTGLGLAVSRQIVERHGGRFDVKSQLEQGSTFTVWLPKGGAV